MNIWLAAKNGKQQKIQIDITQREHTVSLSCFEIQRNINRSEYTRVHVISTAAIANHYRATNMK